MAQGNNRKTTEASSTSELKTPKPLKPEPKIAKKASNQTPKIAKKTSNQTPKIAQKNSNQTLPKTKESPKAQVTQQKRNNESENKEKNCVDKRENGKAQQREQKDPNNEEKLGGLIFLCNGKTKPDCFKYMVMGFPQNQEDLVKSVKPGLKLFLYDFDVKVMYGIYKASSKGGMKLEPSAFNGSFPAQVRFEVHENCLPLPEGVFKNAIKDNYETKYKFRTRLNIQQVNKLTELFCLSPALRSNAHVPQPGPIPLAPPRPITSAIDAAQPQCTKTLTSSSKYTAGETIRPCVPRTHRGAPLPPRETVPRDPLVMTEEDYRKYGLRREPLIPPFASVSASAATSDLSYGTRDLNYHSGSISDQFVLPPSRAAYPSNANYQIGLPQQRADETKYRFQTATEPVSQPTLHRSHLYSIPTSGEVDYGVQTKEAGRLHATSTANALSDYKRRFQQPGGSADLGYLPVSSRYTFAGPSFTNL